MTKASETSSSNPELEQLRNGGAAELGDLFSVYYERLDRMVDFRLDGRLRGRVDSTDVLQEAYLVISRRIDDYVARPDVSLYVWMRQLTLQTLIDVQRRHFGQKRSPNQEVAISLGERDQTSLSIADAICAQWSSPSRAAIREEEVQQLRQALASMDEIDREVLALRHFEHLTNTEVAETLGLTATAASNRYVRAMTRLTELMQRLAGDS